MIVPVGRRGSGRIARRALLVLAACAPAVAHAQLPVDGIPTLAPMIEEVSPAVVNISVSGTVTFDSPLSEDPLFRRFLPRDGQPVQSAGSGVIVDARQGYVLTNHHVVANADRITVTLFDERSVDARVIGSDEGSDIAVLKIDADALSEIRLGDSERLRVGDFVVAIGNPFGLSHTVTSGIVSGLGRSNVTPDAYAYEDFIQTDASINPGNSGGALVALSGELVGINSAILSRGGGNIGIGFAIPVNMARYVMEQLIENGRVERGLLGVMINTVTPDVAAARGLKDTTGALVRSVAPDSAAEGAGLKPDDVITTVNGRPVRDAGSLRNAIGLLRPGERVMVGFVRDGREHSVAATLGSAEEASFASPPAEALIAPVFAGVELAPGAARTSGLLVARVAEGSLAARGGLRAGDLITHVNGEAVQSASEADGLAEGARQVVMDVRRDGRRVSIVLR